MSQIAKAIDKGLSWLLVILTSIMVVTVTWQVLTRYLFNSPSSFTEELATYLLIWISLLGAALAFRGNSHLGINILTQKLNERKQRIVAVISYFTVIIFAILVFVFGGFRLVSITLKLQQISAAFQVPVGYVYTVLPLSGVLMIFYSLVAIWDLLKGKDMPETEPNIIVE